MQKQLTADQIISTGNFRQVELLGDEFKLASAMIFEAKKIRGMPCINPDYPYGSNKPILDIAQILGWEIKNGELSADQMDEARLLHQDACTAIYIIFATGEFKPGTYVASPNEDNWVLRK